MKIFLLGAGPANLALLHAISESSSLMERTKNILVIDREEQPGGQSRSIRWKTHGMHDLGPHKVFSLDQDLMKRVTGILPATAWLRKPKLSRIFMKDRFLPYPPSPFSLAKVFGSRKLFRMGVEFLKCSLAPSRYENTAGSFEDDMRRRIGAAGYELMFKPMALKIWDDPALLDAKLSKGRIQIPSLSEIMNRLSGISRCSRFEAKDFLYPSGGLQTLWNAISSHSQSSAQFLFSTQVTSLDIVENIVRSIKTKNLITEEHLTHQVDHDDIVFSSLPIKSLTDFANPIFSSELFSEFQKTIRYNHLILVFLKIDKPSLFRESWVFIPDPNIAIHRVSEQKSFDPGMTPDGSIVCCEIMSTPSRKMIDLSDSRLIETAVESLKKMGCSFSLQDQKVVRLHDSYPVFYRGFKSVLQKVIDRFDKVKNLRTIGRQGTFSYIGTLDCMDIGFGAADWLKASFNEDPELLWRQERKRTEFYPVLD